MSGVDVAKLCGSQISAASGIGSNARYAERGSEPHHVVATATQELTSEMGGKRKLAVRGLARRQPRYELAW
jgi:hypothetical protein